MDFASFADWISRPRHEDGRDYRLNSSIPAFALSFSFLLPVLSPLAVGAVLSPGIGPDMPMGVDPLVMLAAILAGFALSPLAAKAAVEAARVILWHAPSFWEAEVAVGTCEAGGTRVTVTETRSLAGSVSRRTASLG